MVTLIRWRIAEGRGQPVDPRPATTFAVLSAIEAGIVVVMVFVAGLMARGLL